MKLPLIVKNKNDGELYHVLQFDLGLAIAVNPRTYRIESLRLVDLVALSEAEYAEWKLQTAPPEPKEADPTGEFVTFVDDMDGDVARDWIDATCAITHAFRHGADKVTLQRWPMRDSKPRVPQVNIVTKGASDVAQPAPDTAKRKTKAEHRQRHVDLHKALDELVADWVLEKEVRPSEQKVSTLLAWSYQQTIKPSDKTGAFVDE